MHIEVIVVALFSVATAVALLARRLKLPYTVALVVAGLSLGSVHAFEAPRLTKELLYAVFLPGLLFEAAYHLELRRFLQNKLAIFGLAIPGVIVGVGLTTGFVTPFVKELTVAEALVFASLIGATDPIAVVALFKSVGAPKRLAVLVEGESLLNDGTAVVLFTLVLAYTVGGPTSLPMAALDFVRIVGLGVLVGGVIAYAISFVIHKVDDPMIEITLTTITAYGSFVASEHFGFSGVIATVTAGMVAGNHSARTGMSASTRVAVASFWEYLAFALNSLVFLLIGFEVQVSSLIAAWKPILLAYAAVTLARALVTSLTYLLLRRTHERFAFSWVAILTWGGLRGALSMVLVLGLPMALPQRELIISITFGVVVLSILIQGTTMGPLLRRLGLIAASGSSDRDRLCGSLTARRAALAELERMANQHVFADEVVQRLRAAYEAKAEEVVQEIAALHENAADVLEEELLVARRQLLVTEKDAIRDAYRAGEISEDTYEAILADIDGRLFELESQGDPDSRG